MSKRKYDESQAASGAAAMSKEAKKLKKSKGGQKVDHTEAASTVSLVSAVAPAATEGGEEKLTREDRSKLKSEKKRKREAAKARSAEELKTQSDVEETEDHDVPGEAESKKEDEEEDAKLETSKKAEKAARKAAKKAAKRAKRDGLQDEPVAATKTSNGSNGQSQENGTKKSSSKSKEPATTKSGAGYLEENQITIDEDPNIESSPLPPITDFSQLEFKSEAERAPFSGFKAPTPIQAATWPYLMAGRDAIGVAETGSGKTWAFGLPCVRMINSLPKEKRRGVKAVIVSPTRELALQIHEQIDKLAGPAKIGTVCVYGGVGKDEQRAALKKAKIIVATPGRLNDLIDEGATDLSSAQFVVLDEADRMLDTGFEEDVRKIIGATSADRQTLMFTATWPPSVRDLAATFMKKPVKIIIGDNPTGELRANTRIKQIVEVIQGHEKNMRLMQLLKQHQSGAKKNDRILIFCLYKKEAQRVHQFLQDKGYRVAGIHGDMSQQQRIKNLDDFKSAASSLLVATDVAARGLDIPAVKVVINVTFPLTAEDYVHRIGRTGRAGQDGLAVTLFTEQDKANSGSLINVLRAANQPVPEELLKFGTTVKKKEHSAYGAFYKEVDMSKKATRITFD